MPSKESSSSLVPKYRPDIDGLRAVAVLFVACYHAFPQEIRGGFIGVDIFFVVSGFLISTILFTSLEKGTFSFSDFYIRRIRRIFPALLVVLIACLVLGWFTLLSDEYKQLGKHVAGGTGFVSNFLLWNESGYFDNAADTKPLLHLWSLGIEEQFYLVWPLLLWLAWGKRINLLFVTIIVAMLSFGFNLALYRTDGVADFYSPQTRFWELMVGAALAYMTLHSPQIIARLKKQYSCYFSGIIWPFSLKGSSLWNLVSFFGGLLLFTCTFLVNEQMNFPGVWAILPVLGAIMIIHAGKDAWLNRFVLSAPLLVWLGLISYPFYLWHWPLLSFARIIVGETPSYAIRAAVLLAALVLAWLTYTLVEQRLRFGSNKYVKSALLVIVMLLAGSMGYYTFSRDGLAFRNIVLKHQLIADARTDWKYPGGLTKSEIDGVNIYRNSTNSPTVLIFGDSQIDQFGPRLVSLSSAGRARSTVFLTGGGCPPIPFVYNENHVFCDDHIRNLEKVLNRSPQIDTLVIGACWYCYIIWETKGPPRDGHNYYYEKDGNRHYFKGEDGAQHALEELKEFLAKMKNKYHVYLVLGSPLGSLFDPRQMLQNRLVSMSENASAAPLDQDQVILNDKLKAIGQEVGVSVIDQISHLCPNNLCPRVDASGAPIQFDGQHLRASFVIESAGYIDIVWANSAPPTLVRASEGECDYRAVESATPGATLRQTQPSMTRACCENRLCAQFPVE